MYNEQHSILKMPLGLEPNKEPICWHFIIRKHIYNRMGMCVDNEMGTKVPSPPRAPGMPATPCCLTTWTSALLTDVRIEYKLSNNLESLYLLDVWLWQQLLAPDCIASNMWGKGSLFYLCSWTPPCRCFFFKQLRGIDKSQVRFLQISSVYILPTDIRQENACVMYWKHASCFNLMYSEAKLVCVEATKSHTTLYKF